MGESTTIEISRDTWSVLNSYKEVGDSFDRVLKRILGLSDIQKVEEIHQNKEITKSVYIKNKNKGEY